MNIWQAMEQDFRHSFINYTVHEKAHDDLRKLKMKEENVDQYITDFQLLASWALIDLDNPTAIHIFQMGLSIELAAACINLKNPINFEQWAKAA
jgi:hypothetical protein